MAGYVVARLDELPGVSCPCGVSRRAFSSAAESAATVHLVEISRAARTHYHRRTTEFYVILQGEGFLELDGDRVPVRPLSAVLIRPGCRHRAIGPLTILNVVVPPFDPGDEWFDGEDRDPAR